MKYDFDEEIPRTGTGCSKWDNVGVRIGNEKALPMWVADTDFRCPQPVVDAICQRAMHPIYGYPFIDASFYSATKHWLEKRHHWEVMTEWMVFTTGVVPAIYLMVQTFTNPGDEVIIQQPVYYPFADAIRDNGRVLLNNQLKYSEGHYSIDFDDLENLASRPTAKLLVICNPHNPVGRVWTREELCRLSEICLRNHVIVVSDEIHSDLLLFGSSHIPVASLDAKYAMNTVACYSPSKTFNIAGLRASCIVIPNPQIRERFSAQLRRNRCAQQNVFALPAYVAAYEGCEDYLEQLISYLEGNAIYLKTYLERNMPKLVLSQLEATYLGWIDCRALNMDNDQIADFFVQKCEVAISRGDFFGEAGGGFVRINLGCTRKTLRMALERIQKQYDLLA